MTKCKLHCIQVMKLMTRMMMMLMTMMMMMDKDHDNHDHEDSIDDNEYDYGYCCENAIIFLFRIMLLSRTNSTSETDFSSLFAF